MNFVLIENEENFHNIYRYLNIDSKKELTDLKEIHFIELPKFKKKKPEELKSKFEKWVFALKCGEIYAENIGEIPEELKDEEIVMALNEMVKASEDDVIREILDMRDKARHDEASRLYNAKMEGKAEGKAEGETIGIQKGKKVLLLKLLTKRFTNIPQNIIKTINDIENTEIIDNIIDNLFDLKSIEDLKKFY